MAFVGCSQAGGEGAIANTPSHQQQRRAPCCQGACRHATSAGIHRQHLCTNACGLLRALCLVPALHFAPIHPPQHHTTFAFLASSLSGGRPWRPAGDWLLLPRLAWPALGLVAPTSTILHTFFCPWSGRICCCLLGTHKSRTVLFLRARGRCCVRARCWDPSPGAHLLAAWARLHFTIVNAWRCQ